jgi:uncharacterized protein (TIGR02147 family)
VEAASEAWDRLRRLEIVVHDDRRWRTQYDVASTWSDTPSQAIRNCHRGLLTQALRALDDCGVEEREVSSVVLSTAPQKMGRAKELIREFEAKFMEEVSAGGNRTDVYCLNLQFVNLSSGKPSRSEKEKTE